MTARRALGACAALMVGALALTGCGGNASAEAKGGKDSGSSAKTSTAKIVISAKDGATNTCVDADEREGQRRQADRGEDDGVGVRDGGGGGDRGRDRLEADGAVGARDEVPDLGDREEDANGRTAAANSIFTTVS